LKGLNTVDTLPVKEGFYKVAYDVKGKLFQASVFFDMKDKKWRTPEFFEKSKAPMKGWFSN